MTGDFLLGKNLGGYQLEGIIGRGGVSIIYRGLTPDEKLVAVKVLFPPPEAVQEVLRRFQREADTASQFEHPNIVPVIDMGQADGRAFMVMPLIEGETLSSRLKKKSKLPELQAVEIAWQIADALSYAHRQGIIHRDIKPSNVMLTKDDQTLLMDFGVAHALDTPSMTQAGHIVGTPAYISPEQAMQTGLVDGRADVYSLGVLLYKMVSGHLPFLGSTPQLLHAHVYETPPPLSKHVRVTAPTEALITRAMAKKPQERFPSSAAMAQALSRLSYQLRNDPPKTDPLSGCAARLGLAMFTVASVGGAIYQAGG